MSEGHATFASIAALAPSPAPAVQTRGVSKSHTMEGTQVEVLHDVSLTIDKGDFVAITGASGSGKSTLLSLLGTLDTPTSGEVLIHGCRTKDLKPNALAAFRNAHIGFVFQNFHLLPRTKALDQVMLPALYGRSTSTVLALQMARDRLNDVGLADYERHKPSQLSGGQQQRVAIARALMNSPGLILADEPTGALDQASGHEIMALMRRLNERGMTIVIVTHDASVAGYARRIISMSDGCVVANDLSLAPPARLKAMA